MLEFMLPSILAGIGIAIIAGPLGSFVVWRKMAYFGDTLAHASLLGLALGFLFNVNLYLSLMVCSLGIGAILVLLQKRPTVSSDTLLGILAHSALSLGLIAISFLDNVRIDLMNYLFGDLLAVTPNDLLFIYSGVGVILLILSRCWHALIASTVSEELASIEGHRVDLLRFILMLLIGGVIAIGMKFVGALIMTSLLIIPAATARKLTKSPETMAICASALGIVSVISGLFLSYQYDTPAGPSVVISASCLFFITQFFASVRK